MFSQVVDLFLRPQSARDSGIVDAMATSTNPTPSDYWTVTSTSEELMSITCAQTWPPSWSCS
jgi:hypothetical protein